MTALLRPAGFAGMPVGKSGGGADRLVADRQRPDRNIVAGSA